MPRQVLIVDDDKAMCDLLEADLGDRRFTTEARTTAHDALALLAERSFDVVLTDLNMRGMSGIELCRRVAESRPDVPVVVITAFGSIETAVQAIRAGAYDYITKPIDVEALTLALDRAIEHHALRQEVRRLRRAVDEGNRFGELVGRSDAMRKVHDLLSRVADSDASVLVTGESGTGKEVVAKALHARGRHKNGPFVAVNCAAVPETLLESELFGHVKGAFTDARTARTGLFVQASGGTIFLDEIGELPMGMQPKLLRALQERTVRPVGGGAEVPFDARIVAATNRDLETAIEERRFREDLYYRINVIHVPLPPLRARGGDILLLAQRFVESAASRAGKNVNGISSPAAEKLLAYAWPGNVRELMNAVERAVALTRYEQITADDLPEKIREHRPSSHVLVAADDPSELVPLEEVEKRYALRVLDATSGNKTLAAKILGLDRKTLHRKLERWTGEKGES
ncbi:Response regulator of zinc sigma-54-dependent two-component system [Minicystis rosea]|nr:Response regulator of zinc sigma-54-dependent two-component system [Minicystis rosea]